MNKRLFAGAAGLLSLLSSMNVAAQEDSVKTLPPITIVSTTKVDERVSEAFGERFKEAVDPRWYKMNKNYFVEFISSEQKNRALYQRNGYMVYHIAYGTEANLPDELRRQVKSNYVDYNITSAIKVVEARRNIWVVNLEGKDRMIIVRYEDGDMEEVKNFKKSS